MGVPSHALVEYSSSKGNLRASPDTHITSPQYGGCGNGRELRTNEIVGQFRKTEKECMWSQMCETLATYAFSGVSVYTKFLCDLSNEEKC